jgi:hypothetical protein
MSLSDGGAAYVSLPMDVSNSEAEPGIHDVN